MVKEINMNEFLTFISESEVDLDELKYFENYLQKWFGDR